MFRGTACVMLMVALIACVAGGAVSSAAEGHSEMLKCTDGVEFGKAFEFVSGAWCVSGEEWSWMRLCIKT